MSILTGLEDGVLDPDLIENLELYFSSIRVGRRATRPELRRGPTAHAYSLMRQDSIVNRDHAILETLYNAVPILSADHIQRLFWAKHSPKSVIKQTDNRLVKLWKYHALDRNTFMVPVMGQVKGLSPRFSYFLGPVGISLLAIKRDEPRKELRIPRTYEGLTPTMLLHDLMVSEIYVRIREQVRGTDTKMRWVTEWKSIIRNNNKDELVRPDALIALNMDGKIQRSYLEVERRFRPQKIQTKVIAYETAMREGAWRGLFGMKSFPSVRLVVDGAKAEPVAALIAKHAKNVRWHVQQWPINDFFDDWTSI
ncbi:MAG: hypothetical protein GY803_10300 [Chloroflexi bacterium]|nr:hypothetical protein [Chloroflexota bacterium]